MSKRFLRKYTLESAFAIVESKPLNRYQTAKDLEKRLNYDNAKEILSEAEEYCNNCSEPSNLNPMITCAYNCEIWKVKNKAISHSISH
jgi:hypothetical protein